MKSINTWRAGLTVALTLILLSVASWRVVRAQEARPYSGPVPPLASAVWNERTSDVERLLASGADPDAAAGTPPMTPWQIAVYANHRPSIALFDRHRAHPREHYTPALFKAVLMRGDADLVAAFVKVGASLDFGDAEYDALGIAAANGFVDVMRVLVGAKANVNRQDRFGDTPLMAAVRGGRLEAIDLLIRSGADLALKGADGRTALAWAERTGRPDVVSALTRAGAPAGDSSLGPVSSHPLPGIREAAERGLAALERGGRSWNERRACASCHHAALMVPVAAVAKRRGFGVDAAQIAEHERRLRLLFSGFAPLMRDTASGEEAVVRFSLGFFGQMASGGAWLMAGLADAETKTDDDRLAAAAVGRAQLADGRWRVGLPRVPLQESDIQTTALAARTIAAFAAADPETPARLARARAWLLSSVPATSPEQAYRLIGLRATGASESVLREAVAALAASQAPGGGWSQLPWLNADAYATGLALVALSDGNGIPAGSTACTRGIDYLRRTQQADGSWFVHKRAGSFNPYFESGFPYGLHQFSSFAGTAWATIALMEALHP